MLEPEKTPPKPISQTREFIEHHLFKNLGHLKEAWTAVAIIAITAFCIGYWLEGNLDIKALQGKDATIQELQTRSDNCLKDNEQLERQNRDLRIANAEFTAPLKTRLSILVKQLKEFSQKQSTNSDWPSYVAAHNEFGSRFVGRLSTAASQLDELGLHSDLLNDVSFMFIQMNDIHFTNAVIVATELEKLSKNLKQ